MTTNVTTSNWQTDSVKENVKDKAAQAQQQVKQTAEEVKLQAEQQTKSVIKNGKSQTADQLSTVAQAFRTTGREMRQQDNEAVAHYTEMVADKAEAFSRYLNENEVDVLLGDFENFARRKPEVFLGAAFVGGLLLGRFMKSSESRHHREVEYPYDSTGYQEARLFDTGQPIDYPSSVISHPTSQPDYGISDTPPFNEGQ